MPTLVLPDAPVGTTAVQKESREVKHTPATLPPMPPGETEDDYPSVGMLPRPEPVRAVSPHAGGYRTPTPPL